MYKCSQWLEETLKRNHLSLRQAGIKTGLSHSTIADIRRGNHPSADTVGKLARAFGGDGQRGLALEDQLLVLAGYRTPRPKGKELSIAYATLIDRVSGFNEHQLEVMTRFADFLVEMNKKGGKT